MLTFFKPISNLEEVKIPIDELNISLYNLGENLKELSINKRTEIIPHYVSNMENDNETQRKPATLKQIIIVVAGILLVTLLPLWCNLEETRRNELLLKEGIVTGGLVIETYYGYRHKQHARYVYHANDIEYTGSTLLGSEDRKVINFEDYYEVVYAQSDPTIKRIDFLKPMAKVLWPDGTITYEYVTYEE